MPSGTRLDPYIKDPDSIRTFGIDWDSFLGGLSFSVSTWLVTNGTVAIDSNTTNTVFSLVKLSGGTVGEKCALRNRVTRSDGERDDQTIYVKIKEK